MTEADATHHAKQAGLEIAIVLTEDDPLVCIDVDDCYNPETQEWDDRAKKWFAALEGCYVELSRSRRGLHFFGVAEQGLGKIYHNRKDKIEFYESGRYMIRGAYMGGSADVDIASALKANLTPRDDVSGGALPDEGPLPEWTGPSDDNELIQKALNARGGAAASFGDAARFIDLWNGDEAKLARFYPTDTEGEPFDHSEADGALCAHLAFWTGKDVARIERLWLASPLVRKRPDQGKLQRRDYRHNTVTGAAMLCEDVYTKQREVSEPPAAVLPGTDVPLPTSSTSGYLTIFEQDQHFKGCVYVEVEDKVFTPEGRLLDAKRFGVIYGGYEFQMQRDGGRPTRDAWEAFTRNRCKQFPRATQTCLRPDKPFGAIIDGDVNTCKMPTGGSSDAPVEPFLNHVRKLLPDERDAEILLSWMAGVVQNPGKKAGWCPVLQGVQGNGKSYFTRLFRHIYGDDLVHIPNPDQLGEKYNNYLAENLLIVVEEIHMGGRRSLLESMKSRITDRRIEIRKMYSNPFMADNIANWMFMTNHKDAVIKTDGDRRYAIFFTDQQASGDLLSAGMNSDYFNNLYAWSEKGGFCAVQGFLERYSIQDSLNPFKDARRAPETTSTAEAIEATRGDYEILIKEIIDQGHHGLRGGLVDFAQLRKWLHSSIQVKPNAVADALGNLGYRNAGRIRPDVNDRNKKITVYVKSPEHCDLSEDELRDAYLSAQQIDPPKPTVVVLPGTEGRSDLGRDSGT